MANPQVEDGHTRISNELLESLVRMGLTQYEWQVVLFVIRKTYGYQKKMDMITNSQIVEGTGIYKSHVSRTITKLLNRRMLTRIGKLIGIQKDYELWLSKLPNKVTIATKVTSAGNNNEFNQLPNQVTELPQEVTEKLPNEVTKVTSPRVTQKKKENIQKKNYKRNRYPYTSSPIDPDKYIKGKYGHMVVR